MRCRSFFVNVLVIVRVKTTFALCVFFCKIKSFFFLGESLPRDNP